MMTSGRMSFAAGPHQERRERNQRVGAVKPLTSNGPRTPQSAAHGRKLVASPARWFAVDGSSLAPDADHFPCDLLPLVSAGCQTQPTVSNHGDVVA